VELRAGMKTSWIIGIMNEDRSSEVQKFRSSECREVACNVFTRVQELKK
jgi:hypothetical protein